MEDLTLVAVEGVDEALRQVAAVERQPPEGVVLPVGTSEHRADTRRVTGEPSVAQRLAKELRASFPVFYDESGAIGRRYRRQDEIGTPFCVTVDFDTLEDQAVTIRERDTMEQERVSLDQVEGWLAQRLVGC